MIIDYRLDYSHGLHFRFIIVLAVFKLFNIL